MKAEDVLPRSLYSTAKKIRKYFQSKRFKISEVVPVDPDISYKVHFLFKKKYESIAVEVRERCDLQVHFKSFIDNCHSKRAPIKIYFAVPEKIGDDETIITHAQREVMEKNCIGLLIVKENEIKEDLGTVQCNRKISLEPTHKFAAFSERIKNIIVDYNKGNCLNALRDLSEIVEECTMKIANKAIRKSKIVLNSDEIENKTIDWEGVINALYSTHYRGHDQARILDKSLFHALKSFKDLRNLGDHWKTKIEKQKIEEKYPVSMMQGFDVLRDLVKLINKV